MTDSLYGIDVKKNDGTSATLAEHQGDVLLIVNVASKCGLTPQYEALEKTYEKYEKQGLKILGFPANNFGAQEPGTDEEIKTFCDSKFGVKFPLYAKISVKGDDEHPLYKALTAAKPKAEETGNEFETKLAGYGVKREKADDIMWNFEKFLVSRKGEVVARFQPDVTPDDPRLVKALEAELAKS